METRLIDKCKICNLVIQEINELSGFDHEVKGFFLLPFFVLEKDVPKWSKGFIYQPQLQVVQQIKTRLGQFSSL